MMLKFILRCFNMVLGLDKYFKLFKYEGILICIFEELLKFQKVYIKLMNIILNFVILIFKFFNDFYKKGYRIV